MKNNIQTKDEVLESVTFGNKQDYMLIFSFAETWVQKQFKPFSADELKQAYYDNGGLPPEQPSVIGAVFRDLSKGNLIYHHGYSVSKNPVAHGRMLRTWISREYKLKQQNNASNKSNLKLEL